MTETAGSRWHAQIRALAANLNRAPIAARRLGVFLASYVGLLTLIVLLQPTPFYSGVRQLTAHAAVGGMRLLGVKAEVIGTLVHSQWGIADIGPECTPDYTIAAFVSALLAFPSSQTYRLFGWLIGVPAIMFINVVRIMSLFYLLGVAPEYVDMAHLVIWPILMVLMTVMLWVMWVMCDPRLRNKA